MADDRNDGKLPPISETPREGGYAEPCELPRVEGYEIVRPIGHGGMGTVWSAVQLSTQRQVALKLLGRGAFASEKDRGRFEREVELTARLQHPNIARLYDGSLREGVYYYAMELIDGVPLDKYAEARGLTQRGILELMRSVCLAVQHAHERGVMHRDLKPSNILVTPDGQPHILDFGLAKGFLKSDSRFPVSTNGDAPGTPAYRSPEQASGTGDEIDTRTDVYSLGVILFELLTGESPHDLSGSRLDVLRRIVEEDVRRPRHVTKKVDRELEALLLKALARDPQDRYPSAGAMAHDIENYLTGEPLTARPATAAYFLWKRIKKYRARMAVASVVLAALISIAVFSYISVASERTKAISERKKAVSARMLAQRRLEESEDAREKAQKETAKAMAVNQFIEILFQPLGVDSGQGPKPSLRESLEQATREIGRRYVNRSDIEAAIRAMVGKIYCSIGEHDDAERQLSQALAMVSGGEYDDRPETLAVMHDLGMVLRIAGKSDKSEAVLRRALDIRRRILGGNNADTLQTLMELGTALGGEDKLDEAEALMRQALESQQRLLGEEHEAVLEPLYRLRWICAKKGKIDEEESLMKQIIHIRQHLWGATFQSTLAEANEYAAWLIARGRLDGAQELLSESLGIQLHGLDQELVHAASSSAVNEAGVSPKPGALPSGDKLTTRELEDTGSAVNSFQEDNRVVAWEDFDGAFRLDWRILRPAPSHYSLSKRPGTLTITTQMGTLWGGINSCRNIFLIPREGGKSDDFQLTTCVSNFYPVADWNQAGLICYNDDDNFLKFSYEHDPERLFTVVAESAGFPSCVPWVAPLGLDKVWMRLTKRGNLYTFSMSLDGVAFRPAMPATLGVLRDGLKWGDGSVGYVGIYAKNGGTSAAPDIDASFDFFEVAVPTKESGQEEDSIAASPSSAQETGVATEIEEGPVLLIPDSSRVLVHDDFEGRLGLRWHIRNPDTSHYSLTKATGNLTVTTQKGDLWGSFTDYKNLFLTDFPGIPGEDVELTTCMSSFNPAAPYQQAGLILYNNDDDYLKFVYEFQNRPRLCVGFEAGGLFGCGYFWSLPELGRLCLRVTKRGNRYSFSTSFDGERFFPTRYPAYGNVGYFDPDLTWGDGAVKQVGFIALNGKESEAPETDASFDSFDLRSVAKQVEPTRRRSSPSPPATLRSALSLMSDLGINFLRKGEPDKAEAVLKQCVEVQKQVGGDENGESLYPMMVLADTFVEGGKLGEAEEIHKQMLEIRRRVEGEEHPDVLISRDILAALLNRQGKFTESEGVVRETIAIKSHLLGVEHSVTLDSMMSLAAILPRTGKLEEAEALLRQCLEIRSRVLGKDHPDTLSLMSTLATSLLKASKLDEAESLLMECLEAQSRVLGEGHEDAIRSLVMLIHILDRQRKIGEARTLSERAYRVLSERVKEYPKNTYSHYLLASVCDELDKLEECEREYRTVMELSPSLAVAYNNLAYAWVSRDTKIDEAVALVRKAVELEPGNGAYIDTLGWGYFKQGKFDEALSELQRALKAGFDDPEVYDHLGDVYKAKKMTKEAIEQWQKAVELDPASSDIKEKIEKNWKSFAPEDHAEVQ